MRLAEEVPLPGSGVDVGWGEATPASPPASPCSDEDYALISLRDQVQPPAASPSTSVRFSP